MKVQLPLVAVLLGAAATLSVRAVVVPTPAGGFVCGGIGADERRSLAEESRGTNLAIEFFVANRGDDVADVNLALTPLDGPAAGHRIDVDAAGPLCFVRVAPGRYRIDADFNGVTRSARATIPEHPTHPVRVAIAFPQQAVRGDLDTRPTPEEREEAKSP